MKKLLPLILLLILTVFILPAAQKKHISKVAKNTVMAWRNYPLVSIHDIQYISPDVLHSCDSIDALSGPGSTATGPWLKQASAYYSANQPGGLKDTIEIVGQIIVPPKYITFTGFAGYNFTLRDTGSGSGAWSSLLVRTGSLADTLALYNASLLTYEPGDIIRIRGYVDEFPSASLASGSQLVPIASTFLPDSAMSQCIEYIDTKPVPPPPTVTADQFMKGPYTSSGTNIKLSTGEQWESCYIQLTNLQVSAVIFNTNGTFSMQDASGNEIGMMDGSRWFTLRAGAPSNSPLPYKDPASTYAIPTIGRVIASIRGYMFSNSGSETNRGYRIFPIFPSDIVFGDVYPTINTHRRYPVAVTPSDTVTVSMKVYAQLDGSPLKSVAIHYSVSNGAWQTLQMTGPNAADSTWVGKIPPMNADVMVKYFGTAQDTSGNISIYASAAGGSVWKDTSQGCFFYTVRNRPLTISDVQYTPFSNGLSSLLGAVVTVSGIVTVDSSDIDINNTSGTTPWYIQSGNAPWSGIWVAGSSQALNALKKGDSVSVLGTVQENLDGVGGQIGRVTRIYDSTVTIITHSNALPAPVLRLTGDLAASNGGPTAEPYEGMLVRVENVTISNIAPTFADSTEYAVNDGTGEMIVQSAEGKAKYSPFRGDTVLGKTILKQDDKFSYIQGILYFSFNQYKLVPRNDGDYGTRQTTSVKQTNTEIPKEFALSQNYPNPFNPSTKIEFDLPKNGLVSLKIYNVLGQEIASLVNGNYAAGHYTVPFEASRFTTGIYFYRLQSGSGVAVKKMLLIK